MKEVTDKQPPHPELVACHCSNEECAWTGCFFENAIKRIDPKKLGVDKAYEVEYDLIAMAYDCGCLMASELNRKRRKIG